MTASSSAPAQRIWRRRVELLVGTPVIGGTPDSRLHNGRLARLIRAQGLARYLPEGCPGGEAQTLPTNAGFWLPEVRKKARSSAGRLEEVSEEETRGALA